MQHSIRNSVSFVALAAASAGAMAHTGQGAHSLFEGLVHPLGLDHLLAMLAVGVWSVRALPAHKAWQGPAMFMLVLALSAVLGASGVTLPYLEHAIALSVVVFGAMLALAATRSLPHSAGLGLVALAACLHGLAHGGEAPAAGFMGYAAGFLFTTAVLHGAGVGLGVALRHAFQRSNMALGGVGTLLGCAGLYLASQV